MWPWFFIASGLSMWKQRSMLSLLITQISDNSTSSFIGKMLDTNAFSFQGIMRIQVSAQINGLLFPFLCMKLSRWLLFLRSPMRIKTNVSDLVIGWVLVCVTITSARSSITCRTLTWLTTWLTALSASGCSSADRRDSTSAVSGRTSVSRPGQRWRRHVTVCQADIREFQAEYENELTKRAAVT